MFTGLVQAVGTLRAIGSGAEAKRLDVAVRLPSQRRTVGASLAVCGVCLTVVETSAEGVALDAAFETLEKTTLGGLQVGDRVNLEPSLRVGDPLGGHWVSGHVDGRASVRSIRPRGEAKEIWFGLPAELMPFVAPKGSVCIDGVSLTVNELRAGGFSVGLIPHTLEVTTLGNLTEGQSVNIEVDLVARYVARLLPMLGGTQPTPQAGVTWEKLVRTGFLDSGGGMAGTGDES